MHIYYKYVHTYYTYNIYCMYIHLFIHYIHSIYIVYIYYIQQYQQLARHRYLLVAIAGGVCPPLLVEVWCVLLIVLMSLGLLKVAGAAATFTVVYKTVS